MKSAIMAFILAVNVAAVGLSSQSIDVTVGEVDEIGTDIEGRDIHVPETGIFGLEAGGAFSVATVLIGVPVVVVIACLSRHFCSKRVK